MDDRLAKLLLEDNLVTRLKQAETDIDLLQKLATIKSVDLLTLPVPGETPGATFKKIFVEDDFISATSLFGATSPGILSWISFNAIVSMADLYVFDIRHPGIASIDSSSGNVNWILIAPLPDVNSFDNLQFVMRFNNLLMAGDNFRFGILSTLYPATQEGIYFQYTYGDTNWQTVTGDGASTTQTDAGVAFDEAKWFLFGIKRKTTDVFEFYINQILVATHSTNISTSNVQYPIMFMNNAGAGTFKLFVDYFSIEMATTIQRWT